MNHQGRNARNQTRLLVVAPLVLAYLILDELYVCHLIPVQLNS